MSPAGKAARPRLTASACGRIPTWTDWPIRKSCAANVKALFDTCILIDYLRGKNEARDEIQRYEYRAISLITWMEVMVGANADVVDGTRAFLEEFERIDVNIAIAERAVEVRRKRRIKLPHAIIQATAETGDMLLVTRNTKDFAADLAFVRIPCEI